MDAKVSSVLGFQRTVGLPLLTTSSLQRTRASSVFLTMHELLQSL